MKLNIWKTREKDNRNGLELLIDLESGTEWNYRTGEQEQIGTIELEKRNIL